MFTYDPSAIPIVAIVVDGERSLRAYNNNVKSSEGKTPSKIRRILVDLVYRRLSELVSEGVGN